MGRYFGTDGVRGRANVTLTCEMAFKVGAFLGTEFKDSTGKVLVGMDTRLSSKMFESALAAGLSAGGCDVYLLGVCSTPALAYVTQHEDFDCGIMISASHNPYYDNGIKCFSHEGVKITAELEERIEEYMDGVTSLELASDNAIGKIFNYHEGLEHYMDFMRSLFNFTLEDKTIVLDLANGSATATAVDVFKSLKTNLVVMSDQPDGININTQCGSTHPEHLQAKVLELGADMGFAFDGDADRCIAVDNKGQLVDGDKTLYACGSLMKDRGHLKDDTVVTTVMANLGLYKLFEKCGIHTQKTQVGDKYVYECMVKQGYQLGGEQSGHIIFKEHATTGDGLLTALKLAEVCHERQASLYDVTKDLVIYPQLLKNIPVHDKNSALENQVLLEEVEKVERLLGDEGRVLVRPSGTEPLVRVMVEAKNEELCELYVQQISNVIIERGL